MFYSRFANLSNHRKMLRAVTRPRTIHLCHRTPIRGNSTRFSGSLCCPLANGCDICSVSALLCTVFVVVESKAEVQCLIVLKARVRLRSASGVAGALRSFNLFPVDGFDHPLFTLLTKLHVLGNLLALGAG